MSKGKNPQGRSRTSTRQPAIERAAIPVSAATSGPAVTIPLSVWNSMMQTMAPQKGQAQTFSPGAPLQPIPGITPAAGPRQWSYMPGINLAGNDRTLQRDYIPTFQQLRLLAQTYHAIGTDERIWCDLIPGMTMQVTLTDELKAQGYNDKDYVKERLGYLNFFERPDGQNDYHEWLRMGVVEQTQIDALAIFKRRTRGGKLEGLDVLDGSDIKPLLDERGRIPSPPYAAYQQYSYGTPGQAYTTDDFIYYRESPRAFSPYGFSRVERIITIVNIALRKQQKDLYRFTEGNIPAGMMEVPDTSGWTPDQIETFEQMWNSLLAGNAQQQVRIKFTQPGMKYTAYDQPEQQLHLTEFDEFMQNITDGVYGVSMADHGMTGDIHKSADKGQQNMLYRRTMGPLATAYSRIFTRVLHVDIGDPRFVVKLGGYEEEEDVGAKVSAFADGIQNAMIEPAAAAMMMGWPDIPKTGPLFVTKGGIVPLSSFEIGSVARKASDAAQLAGYQLATQNAEAKPGEDDEEDGSSSQQPPAAPAKKQQPGGGSQDDEEDEEVDKGLDDADKSLSSLNRLDPVHAWHGEFGYDPSAAGHAKAGHHKGVKKSTQHTKRPKLSAKARMQVKAQKLAARFAKLEARKLGKHWSAAQHEAAGALQDIFSQITSAIEKGGQQQLIDGLLDKAYDAAKTLFAGKPKGLNAMAHALTIIDTANDKGALRAAEGDDADDEDEDEETFDALLEALDELEVEDEEALETQATLARVADVLARAEEALRLAYARSSPEPLISQQGSCQCEICTTRAGQEVQEPPPYHGGCDCRAVPKGAEHVARASSEAEAASSQGSGNESGAGRLHHESAAGAASTDALQPGAERHDPDQKGISADYRRWRTRAVEDARLGRIGTLMRSFSSDVIPENEQVGIARALAYCATPDDVRKVFADARTMFNRAAEDDGSPKAPAASGSEAGGNPARTRSAWKLRW